MGCIYRVQDNVLGEEVALKTLLPQFLKDKLVVERFFNEARIARKLSHPNVVRVHDIGQASSMVYISMEFLPGRSLRDLLEGMMPGQRMPIQQTLHIIDQLCAALEYAHKYTIHRDIKPENVMILPDGTVKLMDFGISKLMANTRMTGASVVMGTPFYMSPEQLRNSRDVDARADVFSVGVVLYETLTGNVPTGVPKPASHFQSDVPASLDAIITKCVDPEPRNRYQNATELRQALRPVMESINVTDSARPAAQPRSGASFPARKVAGVALAALILAGTAGAVYVYDGRAPSTPSEAAAPTSSAPAASRYALYRAVAERARGRAQGAVSGSGLLEDALKEGDRLLAEAEGLSDRDTALKERYARQAMQHYVAVALRPRASGMTFVPGGMVEEDGTETWVAPFYIDEQEVSRGEFAAFCSSVSGGWRAEFATVSDEEGMLPVTNVRFYDALAFAASKGRGIPTDLEWARAAYGGAESSRLYPWGTEWRAEACYCEEPAPAPVSEYREDTTWVGARNMLGNVAEWTSTPEDGGGAVDFGVPMRVRGGWYGAGESVLAERATMLYERYSALLGFRCVLRAPEDPVEAARLLDGVS
jgi:formylglycine-generating enzyme required for sulfatase activity